MPHRPPRPVFAWPGASVTLAVARVPRLGISCSAAIVLPALVLPLRYLRLAAQPVRAAGRACWSPACANLVSPGPPT